MTVWTVPATITRWVDADTLTARLSLGWHLHLDGRIRVEGCDAPELRTPAGKAALAWTQAFVPVGLEVTCVSRSLDKYGRVLGALVLPNGDDYATALIKAGHAKPYNGGTR